MFSDKVKFQSISVFNHVLNAQPTIYAASGTRRWPNMDPTSQQFATLNSRIFTLGLRLRKKKGGDSLELGKLGGRKFLWKIFNSGSWLIFHSSDRAYTSDICLRIEVTDREGNKEDRGKKQQLHISDSNNIFSV